MSNRIEMTFALNRMKLLRLRLTRSPDSPRQCRHVAERNVSVITAPKHVNVPPPTPLLPPSPPGHLPVLTSSLSSSLGFTSNHVMSRDVMECRANYFMNELICCDSIQYFDVNRYDTMGY